MKFAVIATSVCETLSNRSKSARKQFSPEGKDRNRDFFVTDFEFMNDDGLFTVLRRMSDNGGEPSIANDRALRPTEMANK